MSKVVVSEFVTLDGVMEDPGGAENFEHGGWSFQFWSDDSAQYKFDELFASDALLLGRVTYQGFAKAWPTIKDESGFADRMNKLPKYVVSTTLANVEWNNSTLIRRNVAAEVKKLKDGDGGDILVAGSRRLVETLLDHDLVDEIRLMVSPVVLGTGKRLFESLPKKKTLELVDTTPFTTGAIALTYRPAQA